MTGDMELIRRAVIVAKDKHPEGFNKSQLVAASNEVFGGMGKAVLSGHPVELNSMEDVANMSNAMAFIDGNYPAGLSGCFTVGINGGCGYECPVFLSGDCDEHQHDMLLALVNGEDEGADEVADIFDQVGEDMLEFMADNADSIKAAEGET